MSNKSMYKAHILVHPLRLKILQSLQSRHHLADITKRTGISEKLVSYHLLVLSKANLVKSEYKTEKIQGAPRVVKYYDRSSEAHEIVKTLNNLKL